MRKRSGWKKAAGVVVAAAMTAVWLAGCGSSAEDAKPAETEESTAQVESGTSAEEKIKVSVGIGNMFVPFCYLDDDENPTGYDYDVICAVAEKLSDKYEFVITPDDFSNLLIGLDTGNYDIAVHHFGYTAERAENYLYAKEADMYFGNFHIGYVAGRTDITDLASCAGMTIAASSGSMAENLLETWNEENPDKQVIIEHSGSDLTAIHAGLISGLYDCFVGSQYDLDTFSAQYDNFLEYSDYNVTPEGYDCGAYFVYSKGAETLQEDVDAALVQLREEGTLKALSEQWLGNDYSENPNQ